MAKFYVLKARKIVLMLLLLGLIGLTFWYVLQPPSQPTSTGGGLGFWRQFAPQSLAVTQPSVEAEEAVQVFLPTSQEVPEELGDSVVVSVKPVPTKFSEYRMERERVRSRQMELLESVLYGKTTSEERKAEAQQQLLDLIALMTRETELENLLKAKGYIDAVAVINENSVTVVVPTTLTREDASHIGELTQRLTGVRLERITIIDEPSQ